MTALHHGRVAFLPFCKVTLKAPKPSPTYPKVLNALGDHLKKRRLDLGLFQKEFALRLGVNQWTVINWEKGRTEPPARFWPRIIAFLGYDPYPPPENLAERIAAIRRNTSGCRARDCRGWSAAMKQQLPAGKPVRRTLRRTTWKLYAA